MEVEFYWQFHSVFLARWQNVHLLKDVPAVNPVFTIVFIIIAIITIWSDFKQCIVTKELELEETLGDRQNN